MRYVRKQPFVLFVALWITLYIIGSRVYTITTDPGTIITVQNQGPLFDHNLFQAGTPKLPGSNHTLTIVTGHLQNESVEWLHNLAASNPHFTLAIYPIDHTSSTANLSLPANKGHEAMVYLTYIIDHYDKLSSHHSSRNSLSNENLSSENAPSDVVLFIHPHDIAWHNNVLLSTSMSHTISALNLEHVIRQGYFNTRCHLRPGSPSWLLVNRPWYLRDGRDRPEERFLTTEVFHAMHGDDTPLPGSRSGMGRGYIGQPCCAQFAVSTSRILQRPKEFYERYRAWLLDTELDDKTSGRLMEYSWQYLFTNLWEFYPSQSGCYCGGYGVCFEGQEKGLNEWLRVLKTRERLDEKNRVMREKGRDSGGKSEALRSQSNAIGLRLEEMRVEAVRRGRDAWLREEESRPG